MKILQNNYAFVDSQNLNLAIRDQGWILDFARFRVYLKDKYNVSKAFLFIGYVAGNQQLYNFLQTNGYVLIFKPVLENKDHIIKGNIDAELVLQAMIDYVDYDQAVLVTGDGDFYCLVKYLDNKDKLARVLAPSNKSCSRLLRKEAKKKIALVSDLKSRIEYKKRTS